MLIDVDSLLNEGSLQLKLGGKEYTIKDVPLPTFAATMKDVEENPQNLKGQLAQLMGIDVNELEGVGLKAVSLSLKAIKNWMTAETNEEK